MAIHGGPYSIKNPNLHILDYSSNVNPLGYPKSIKKSLKSWMKQIPVYPDHTSFKLKRSLADYLEVSIDNLVVGNGATEIIYNFCHAIINKTNILIAVPTFSEYEFASKLYGGKLHFFKTMNLENDLKKFIQQIPRNGLVFVCNPNNPTGVLISKKSIIQILKMAKRKNTVVFVDECFIELTQTPKESVVDQIPKFGNLFVLRSLTKSFGLAGLRIGYGIGSKKLVSVLNKIKIPWNVSIIAQDAAISALTNKSFLVKTRKLIKQESFFLKRSISKMNGFSCFDTSTNFILVETSLSVKNLQKQLLKKQILIRDCSSFRGLNQNYFRIAVKTRKENRKLIKSLEELL